MTIKATSLTDGFVERQNTIFDARLEVDEGSVIIRYRLDAFNQLLDFSIKRIADLGGGYAGPAR